MLWGKYGITIKLHTGFQLKLNLGKAKLYNWLIYIQENINNE